MNPGVVACWCGLVFFFLSVIAVYLYNKHLVNELEELDRKEKK
jgi:hypothetical protein